MGGARSYPDGPAILSVSLLIELHGTSLEVFGEFITRATDDRCENLSARKVLYARSWSEMARETRPGLYPRVEKIAA
jgi:hypothetical protein